MCSTSEAINELAAALSKAQGQMRAAAKDSTNPHFKSRYADLASVVDAAREPLANNGLAVVQGVATTEKGVRVSTLLMHASGQWIKSELDVPAMKLDAQGLGSATTYGRRYGLSAMVGIAPDDDDGNAATGKDEKPQRREQRKEEPKPDTRKQAREYEAAMSPEELEHFANTRNALTARINKAVSDLSLMDLETVGEELKTADERIKAVMRPVYRSAMTVIKVEHVPPQVEQVI